MHANYYEGVLQLRNPTEQVEQFIIHEFKRKKTVFITKEKRMKDGVDLYVTDQRFLQSLGKRLQEAFPGELKVSGTLHTRNKQTSKDVYRITVFFRLYPFARGKHYRYRGEDVMIMRWGKKVTVKSASGRRLLVDFHELKDI